MRVMDGHHIFFAATFGEVYLPFDVLRPFTLRGGYVAEKGGSGGFTFQVTMGRSRLYSSLEFSGGRGRESLYRGSEGRGASQGFGSDDSEVHHKLKAGVAVKKTRQSPLPRCRWISAVCAREVIGLSLGTAPGTRPLLVYVQSRQ